MRVVVTDTGPLNYLVLIGAIDILLKLFNRVAAPRIVGDELSDNDTPAVRDYSTRFLRVTEIDAGPFFLLDSGLISAAALFSYKSLPGNQTFMKPGKWGGPPRPPGAGGRARRPAPLSSFFGSLHRRVVIADEGPRPTLGNCGAGRRFVLASPQRMAWGG